MSRIKAEKIGFGKALVKGKKVFVFGTFEGLYFEARAKSILERRREERAKIVLVFEEEE